MWNAEVGFVSSSVRAHGALGGLGEGERPVLVAAVLGEDPGHVVDLDVVGAAVSPGEADAPLIGDADAVLSFAIPGELLQAVAGRGAGWLESMLTLRTGDFARRMGATSMSASSFGARTRRTLVPPKV